MPHRGATEAVNAVITAQVSFGFIPVGLALPFIRASQLRALAVAAETRNPLLADLPTVTEAGVPGISPVHWWIIAFAPAGTPPAVTEKLNREIRAASQRRGSPSCCASRPCMRPTIRPTRSPRACAATSPTGRASSPSWASPSIERGEKMFYEPDKDDHGLKFNPYKSIVVPRRSAGSPP